LPLLALTVALILAWIISMATSRMRNKSPLTLIISLAFLIGYFSFYSKVQKYLNDLVANGKQIAEAFQRAMPPFYNLGVAITKGDFAQMGLFILWMVVPFAICIWILSLNFIKLLTKTKNNANVKYKAKELETSTPTWALVKKEMAYYWAKPMVILNSSMGSVLMIIGAIYLLWQKNVMMKNIGMALSLVRGSGITIGVLMAAALTVVCSMNNLSASLVSLEGKYLWIAKSIPISWGSVLKSKVITHILVTSIPCFIASILLSFFATTPNEWLLIFILPQTFTLLIAMVGIVLNNAMPRFEWISEMTVVKQGASAMITLFGAMAVVIGLAAVYVWVIKVPIVWFLWGCAVVFVVGSMVAYGRVKVTK